LFIATKGSSPSLSSAYQGVRQTSQRRLPYLRNHLAATGCYNLFVSLKNVDIESGIRRLADRRIEDAIADGKFDRLEGAGKPLDLEDMPAEENQRLKWWALRILKRNDVIPHEIVWRKQIETLKLTLQTAKSEAAVRTLVSHINDLVRKVNTLGTNARPSDLALLDADVAVVEWRVLNDMKNQR
jgi:hypothetical protein